jgi:general secretion pathway protein E
VVRTINAILLEALRERASDIHFEPFETRSLVRFRIDGVLREVVEPPRALHAALVSRLKIMANLDIAERRLPQDGRISLKLGDKPVDVRVSTVPTGNSERVVLRLLDQDSAHLDLGVLGMDPVTLNAVDALVRRPHGIVLVTGPPARQDHDVHAALSRLDRAPQHHDRRRPIDMRWTASADTSQPDRPHFRAGAALDPRDPDVIMIGEIRDAERRRSPCRPASAPVLATLHQQRGQRRDMTGRHGNRAVPARLSSPGAAQRWSGPAPLPQALRQ